MRGRCTVRRSSRTTCCSCECVRGAYDPRRARRHRAAAGGAPPSRRHACTGRCPHLVGDGDGGGRRRIAGPQPLRRAAPAERAQQAERLPRPCRVFEQRCLLEPAPPSPCMRAAPGTRRTGSRPPRRRPCGHFARERARSGPATARGGSAGRPGGANSGTRARTARCERPPAACAAPCCAASSAWRGTSTGSAGVRNPQYKYMEGVARRSVASRSGERAAAPS